MPQLLLTDLPTDVLGLVLVRLGRGQGRARDIARTALACREFRKAARLAERAHRRVCLEGHTGMVICVAAADGRIITGSGDRTVKMWRDGACELTLQHDDGFMSVAVLPGGARFVSGSDDSTAMLWTLDGALERTFEVGSDVNCVAVLPDGVHFAAGFTYFGSYEVRLYHVDGTRVHRFKGHTNNVSAVAVTPDGQHIVSGSWDRRVKVWRVATKSLVSTCEGTDAVNAVAVMPDGQRILSGSWKKVRVWLLNGTLENTLTLHTSHVYALVALPDNQHALSGSYDSTVKLFNVNDGAVVRTFTHHTNAVHSLALLPDGLRFVSCSEDKTARIAYHGFGP